MVLTSGWHTCGREADINPAATWTSLHRECISIDCNSDLPSLKARKQLYLKPAQIFHLSFEIQVQWALGAWAGFCGSHRVEVHQQAHHSYFFHASEFVFCMFYCNFLSNGGCLGLCRSRHIEGLWHWLSEDFHLGFQGVCIGVFTLDSTLTVVFTLPNIL